MKYNKEGNEPDVKIIYIRNYSKIIFFYPILITSFMLWILELILKKPIQWFGLLWFGLDYYGYAFAFLISLS
ncbi:MAG: hypothetical protein ACTSR8_19750 [Promethearchaeota archaeon]